MIANVHTFKPNLQLKHSPQHSIYIFSGSWEFLLGISCSDFLLNLQSHACHSTVLSFPKEEHCLFFSFAKAKLFFAAKVCHFSLGLPLKVRFLLIHRIEELSSSLFTGFLWAYRLKDSLPCSIKQRALHFASCRGRTDE